MRKLWCQLWNAFLNAFRDAITVITEAAIQLSRAVITIFTEAIDAIGSSLGNNPLVLALGLGLLLWFIPKGDDRDKKKSAEDDTTGDNDYYHDAKKRDGESAVDVVNTRSTGVLRSYVT